MQCTQMSSLSSYYLQSFNVTESICGGMWRVRDGLDYKMVQMREWCGHHENTHTLYLWGRSATSQRTCKSWEDFPDWGSRWRRPRTTTTSKETNMNISLLRQKVKNLQVQFCVLFSTHFMWALIFKMNNIRNFKTVFRVNLSNSSFSTWNL